jgi:DNA mismatch endonuclease (patch repair protein)
VAAGRRLKTDPRRSALMKRVRQRGTPLEVEVGRICTSLGLRYRRNVKTLPGSPDLANRSRRWAIFAHGCFWHHHDDCGLATVPTRNARFWTEKFAANRERDARKIAQLKGLGFRVLVVWQCELDDRRRLVRRLSNLGEARIA